MTSEDILFFLNYLTVSFVLLFICTFILKASVVLYLQNNGAHRVFQAKEEDFNHILDTCGKQNVIQTTRSLSLQGFLLGLMSAIVGQTFHL